MTVTPLKPSVSIRAKGYTHGRSQKVRLLAIHTAEGSTNVTSLGKYFAGTTAGSSNAGIGQNGEYAEYVPYTDTPWTNPPVNSCSDTVELCGFSRWTRAEWLGHKAMLETVARWIAWRSEVRGIPIVHLTGTHATGSGVVGHKDVNDTYHKSSHTDPGPNFPWDTVIARAKAIRNPPAKKAPAPAPAPTHPAYKSDLKAGSSGPLVVTWQTQMRKRGWAVTVDGKFGPQSVNVARQFRTEKKITPYVGVVDRRTWDAAWTAAK